MLLGLPVRERKTSFRLTCRIHFALRMQVPEIMDAEKREVLSRAADANGVSKIALIRRIRMGLTEDSGGG